MREFVSGRRGKSDLEFELILKEDSKNQGMTASKITIEMDNLESKNNLIRKINTEIQNLNKMVNNLENPIRLGNKSDSFDTM